MSVEVRIPAVFRAHTGGSKVVTVEGTTVGDVLTAVAATYPELGDQIFAEADSLHRFVNVYLNSEDVRYLDGLESKTSEGDVLAILPAVAGGKH